MEFWIVVAMIGFGGYSLFRANTKRGVETVRSYVYLSGVATGHSEQESNAAANYDVANGPTEVIQDAIAHLNRHYAGKQSAMISDAYRQGMIPRLPTWYRSVFLRA